ncbi:MAG TPA: cytochrome b N-terminal domain-containing protein [Anaerolineae bacterium]|nr:cytochrome b N-terminal domain-containing protein [Anaerolineae bacterium]
MATFVDKVREMGPRRALISAVDETVERLTIGMNIGDIRSALRGDEPRRPNPRLRPHADGFWLHIRPSFYHTEVTHIYPTFRMGWLSTFMFIWETITGIFLMVFYTPSPQAAYSNIWNILSNVPLGQLMRNLHRFGAEVMVLVVALHMLRTYVTGSYKKPRQFTWATGIVLLVLTLLLSFSGYLLPWDQLAYWALTVFLSGAEAAPAPAAVNANVLLLLQGAPSLGAGGLLRWYLFHVLLLPLLLGIFFFVHYYKVVLYNISLPPGREEIGEDTAKRVPKSERVYFIPDILTSELMWTGLTTLFLVAGSVWFYNAPLENQANPLVTPLHVVAPWYLAWSQGWLKLADKTIVVGFIPVLMIMFTLFPYWEWETPSRRYADRRIGLSVAMFFIVFMFISNWMGSPEYLVNSSAEQEVTQEILPQEGHSELLSVPYDELHNGVYRLEEHDGELHVSVELEDSSISEEEAIGPHLSHAFHALEEAIYLHSCNATEESSFFDTCEVTTEGGNTTYSNFFFKGAMTNPVVELHIQQYQANMKKLSLHFATTDPETGEPVLEIEDAVGTKFRHIDSNYEED